MIRSFVLAAAAFAAVATAAHADEQIKVSTKGLDLSTPAGATTFYRHLSHAATAVCGGAPTSFFISGEEHFQNCYKQVMDEAVSKAEAPLVASVHTAKTGHRTAMASR